MKKGHDIPIVWNNDWISLTVEDLHAKPTGLDEDDAGV